MSDPAWALQKAVYAALTGDAALRAALGGPHVFDHVPRRTKLPYVTFAGNEVRDASSGDGAMYEHALTLNVWAAATGAKKVAAVMGAIRDALHDADLVLDGHRLVNLRHVVSEIKRSDDGERLNGNIAFRAVTEPARR